MTFHPFTDGGGSNAARAKRTRTTWKSSLQGQETTHCGVFRRAGLSDEEAARPAVEPYLEPMEGRNGSAIWGCARSAAHSKGRKTQRILFAYDGRGGSADARSALRALTTTGSG